VRRLSYHSSKNTKLTHDEKLENRELYLARIHFLIINIVSLNLPLNRNNYNNNQNLQAKNGSTLAASERAFRGADFPILRPVAFHLQIVR
jgi:hypothetical protein